MGAAQVRSPGGRGGGEGQDEQGVHFTVGGLQEIGSSVDKVKRPVKLLAMTIDIHIAMHAAAHTVTYNHRGSMSL